MGRADAGSGVGAAASSASAGVPALLRAVAIRPGEQLLEAAAGRLRKKTSSCRARACGIMYGVDVTATSALLTTTYYGTISIAPSSPAAAAPSSSPLMCG